MELERSQLQESGVGADPLVSAIKAVVTQASRENLLPKIMWKADKEFGSKKLLDYQKSVHRKYEYSLINSAMILRLPSSTILRQPKASGKSLGRRS